MALTSRVINKSLRTVQERVLSLHIRREQNLGPSRASFEEDDTCVEKVEVVGIEAKKQEKRFDSFWAKERWRNEKRAWVVTGGGKNSNQ